jgi:hypothetical protein
LGGWALQLAQNRYRGQQPVESIEQLEPLAG